MSAMTMRTVRLEGQLAELFGAVHHVAANNIRQILRYFSVNFKDFDSYLIDSDTRQMAYEVWDGDHDIEGKEADFVKQGLSDVTIIPRIAGAGAAGRIIAGVVLVIVGAYFGQAWLVQIGASLVIGGVVELLSKNPATTQNETENSRSYLFSGPINSTRQGNPITLGYGMHIVGSQVISASVVSNSTVPLLADTTPPNDFTLLEELGSDDYDSDSNGDDYSATYSEEDSEVGEI